jgi:16S rRNA (cytidine1402-2'-O)-methyltransferase
MYPPTDAPCAALARGSGRVTGTLFVVAVPIGNPADITLRAVETLSAVDVVAAEDTRHFATLARAHGLRTRAVSLHEHNEEARIPELVAQLQGGASVAVVSDAGTPLINDPGFRLVRAAISAGVRVTSLPGPSAVTTALSAAGLAPVPFRFCGFPPRTPGSRRAFFEAVASDSATLVLFEAPHRLLASLQDARRALGDRRACLARNLTKPHEAYQRGRLSELVSGLEAEGTARGECTVIIEGAERSPAGAGETAERAADLLLRDGAPPRAVITVLTAVFGVSHRMAYQLAHRRPPDR